jgi:hypothetical protein
MVRVDDLSQRTVSRIYLHQGNSPYTVADLSAYESEVGSNQRTKPRPITFFSDHDELRFA